MESKNNIRHVEGVESHGKKWNTEDTQKCIQLFNNGKSDEEISDDMKRTPSSIKFKRMKHIDEEVTNGKTYNELGKIFKYDAFLVEKLHQKEQKRIQRKLDVKETISNTTDNDSQNCNEDQVPKNNINDDDFIKDFENMVKLHDIMLKTQREQTQVQELADIISLKFKQYVKEKKEKYL